MPSLPPGFPRGARTVVWHLPLLFLAWPVWMAWRYTCPVPRADHWGLVIGPYLKWQGGATFWESASTQINDSRMEVPIAIHLMLAEWAHWNLLMESLLTVGMWAVTAWLLLRELRTLRGVEGWWPRLVPWLALLWTLSPRQWMNWTWGIQVCYAMVVLSTLATLACLRGGAPRWARVLAGAICATVAVHTFINGWFAWILGGGYLLWEAASAASGKDRRQAWLAVGSWLLLAALVGWEIFRGYELREAPRGPSLSERLMENPGAFLLYFLNVLGAPFSDVWPTWDRGEFRLNVNMVASVVIATASLLAGLALLWRGWKGDWRGHGAAVTLWLLFAAWGLGNALAIAIARTGNQASNPFESRYPAYTLWYYVALLGLWCHTQRGWVGHLRWAWLALVLWGTGTGIFQALRDVRLDFDRNRLIATAVAARNAAPETLLLRTLINAPTSHTVAVLNQLDERGLLQVPAMPPKPEENEAWKQHWGQIQQGGVGEGTFYLKGWGMDRKTRDSLDGILVSMQPAGQEERWLGVAQRRPYRMQLAKNRKSVALYGRVGWDFTYGYMGTLKERPNEGPPPVPAGLVTFRAYGVDLASGGVRRLDGEVTLELPEALPYQVIGQNAAPGQPPALPSPP